MARADERVFGDCYYDAGEHCLCCAGHVLNLVVKAFWFGDVDHTLFQDSIVVTCNTMATWKKMGPWVNTHNISIYVLASPQWWQEFKQLGAQTIVHRDNATRWNTRYNMILNTLLNRAAVEVFCLPHSNEMEHDHMSRADWEQLPDAVTILEPFHSATLRMEGHFAELHTLDVELDFLRTTWTNALQRYHANPHLRIQRAAAEAIEVLDKYQKLYKSLTVCVAAVVLHPAYKWEYFEVAVDNLECTDDQLQDAKLRVQALWLTKYMPGT